MDLWARERTYDEFRETGVHRLRIDIPAKVKQLKLVAYYNNIDLGDQITTAETIAYSAFSPLDRYKVTFFPYNPISGWGGSVQGYTRKKWIALSVFRSQIESTFYPALSLFSPALLGAHFVSSITKLRMSTFKMIETFVMVVTFGYTGAERNFS